VGRAPGAGFKFAVVSTGKEAVTHYEVVEAFRGASLLEVGLEPGRTHQIRVHLAAVGHPLVGDQLYGANPVTAAALGMTRQALHATRLAFDHPLTAAPLTFTSPPPPDLAAALSTLRNP
jgi:23S rRNA pseudouridine1911/1915/1917 synthase